VGVNIPTTSSVGRLFDAVAALLGLRQTNGFEGDAAMALEFAAWEAADEFSAYPVLLAEDAAAGFGLGRIVEIKPMLDAMLSELSAPDFSGSRGEIARMAAKFHNTLAAMVVDVAHSEGIETVALSGGCFQNRLLLERTATALRQAGFTPWWQQRIPPNDGGIAAGQVYGAVLFDTDERKEHNDVSRSSRPGTGHRR
jgi:hydrogenase maturation protein HypF